MIKNKIKIGFVFFSLLILFTSIKIDNRILLSIFTPFSSAEDIYEDNDDYQNAIQINYTSELLEFRSVSTNRFDYDYFKFYMEANTTITISCYRWGSNAQLKYDYSESDSFLVKSGSIWRRSWIVINASNSGWAYIYMKPASNNYRTTYLYYIELGDWTTIPRKPIDLRYSNNNHSNPGDLELSWDHVHDLASSYSVYRSEQPIVVINNDVDLLGNVTSTYFKLNYTENCTFYYAVTGNNNYGSSNLSDSIFIEVKFLPPTPTPVSESIKIPGYQTLFMGLIMLSSITIIIWKYRNHSRK